jgi:hypothetical protein
VTARAARLSFLLAVAAVAQGQAQPPPPPQPVATGAGTLEGIVINTVTRVGVSGVDVTVNARDVRYSTTTDAAGRFIFRNMKEDEYRSSVHKDGFAIPPNFPGNRPVRVGTGNPARTEIELTPYSSLRGRVVDENRQPVAGANVQLSLSLGTRDSVTTSAEGSFEFKNLLPATVTLLARPKPPERRSGPEPAPTKSAVDGPLAGEIRLGLVATYYPSVTDPAQAAKIIVQGGADMNGYEIQMQRLPVYRVRGVVLDESGKPAPKVTVQLGKRRERQALTVGGMMTPVNTRRAWIFGPGAERDSITTVTDKAGAFVFEEVSAGDWKLQAESEWGWVESTKQDTQDRGYAEVTVGRRDVEGLEIRLARNFSLPVRVNWESPVPPAGTFAEVMLVPLDGGNAPPVARRRPDGTFHITQQLWPGRYMIAPESLAMPAMNPGYYLSAARIAGTDVLGQAFELSSTSPPIEVVYRNKGATLRGAIERAQQGTVLLFPASRTPGLDIDYLWGMENLVDGRFEFNSLRPGEYYVVAFNRIDDSRLAEPGFLTGAAAAAKLVRLEEGATQSVELNVTPWRE